MPQLIYKPMKSGKKITIVCFVSGSGTNYREIVKRSPEANYLVFTNRPGCGGVEIARENHHAVIELSHIPYLREARKTFGAGNVPRNCPERELYEKEVSRLIEERLGGQPDLICLAGFDQWNTDWFMERYYPRVLNVHPGDTTKGYDGLHWIPAAKAILAGDKYLSSTLFIADKSEDKGPVLVQSRPLNITFTLSALENKGERALVKGLHQVTIFAQHKRINTYEEFKEKADVVLLKTLEHVCSNLQNELKIKGDWEIYPFAVHDLIAQGRVAVDRRTVYIDGKKIPEYGYRLDEKQ